MTLPPKLARLLLPILLLASPALGEVNFEFDSNQVPNGTHLGGLRVFLTEGEMLDFARVVIEVPPDFIDLYDVIPNELLNTATAVTFPVNQNTGLQQTDIHFFNLDGEDRPSFFLAATKADVTFSTPGSIEKGKMWCEYALIGEGGFQRICDVTDISFRGAVPVPMLGKWGTVALIASLGVVPLLVLRRRV